MMCMVPHLDWKYCFSVEWNWLLASFRPWIHVPVHAGGYHRVSSMHIMSTRFKWLWRFEVYVSIILNSAFSFVSYTIQTYLQCLLVSFWQIGRRQARKTVPSPIEWSNEPRESPGLLGHFHWRQEGWSHGDGIVQDHCSQDGRKLSSVVYWGERRWEVWKAIALQRFQVSSRDSWIHVSYVSKLKTEFTSCCPRHIQNMHLFAVKTRTQPSLSPFLLNPNVPYRISLPTSVW